MREPVHDRSISLSLPCCCRSHSTILLPIISPDPRAPPRLLRTPSQPCFLCTLLRSKAVRIRHTIPTLTQDLEIAFAGTTMHSSHFLIINRRKEFARLWPLICRGSRYRSSRRCSSFVRSFPVKSHEKCSQSFTLHGDEVPPFFTS